MILYFGKPLKRGFQVRSNAPPDAWRVLELEVHAMYAVIETGGKQYRVTEGDIIYVEKLDQEPDSIVNFDVLMVGEGKTLKIGKPTVKDATVEGKVLGQVKGEKLIIYKYKAKKNYHRTAGHRQNYTKVEITGISK